MKDMPKVMSKLLELSRTEQERLIDLARKDACKKHGKLFLWAKWSFIHVAALAAAAAFSGFSLAALFHAFRSEAPSSTIVAVVIGVGFATLWPYAQRIISVCVLSPEIGRLLDDKPT